MSSLDLSNFNTEKVTEMSHMFQDCSGLKTIYAGDSFTAEAFANDIFNNCKNLVGHEKYEENKTGVEYANYKTGYFIKKVGMLGTDVLGATGEDLTLTKELTLCDDADLVLTESVKAKNVSSSRTVTSTWGTLCVPFALTQNEDNNWSYYRSRVLTMKRTVSLLIVVKKAKCSWHSCALQNEGRGDSTYLFCKRCFNRYRTCSHEQSGRQPHRCIHQDWWQKQ